MAQPYVLTKLETVVKVVVFSHVDPEKGLMERAIDGTLALSSEGDLARLEIKQRIKVDGQWETGVWAGAYKYAYDVGPGARPEIKPFLPRLAPAGVLTMAQGNIRVVEKVGPYLYVRLEQQRGGRRAFALAAARPKARLVMIDFAAPEHVRSECMWDRDFARRLSLTTEQSELAWSAPFVVDVVRATAKLYLSEAEIMVFTKAYPFAHPSVYRPLTPSQMCALLVDNVESMALVKHRVKDHLNVDNVESMALVEHRVEDHLNVDNVESMALVKYRVEDHLKVWLKAPKPMQGVWFTDEHGKLVSVPNAVDTLVLAP